MISLLVTQKDSFILSCWDLVLGWEYAVTNEFVPFLHCVPAWDREFCSYYFHGISQGVQGWLLFTTHTHAHTHTHSNASSLPSVHAVNPCLNVYVAMATLRRETEIVKRNEREMQRRRPEGWQCKDSRAHDGQTQRIRDVFMLICACPDNRTEATAGSNLNSKHVASGLQPSTHLCLI